MGWGTIVAVACLLGDYLGSSFIARPHCRKKRVGASMGAHFELPDDGAVLFFHAATYPPLFSLQNAFRSHWGTCLIHY